MFNLTKLKRGAKSQGLNFNQQLRAYASAHFNAFKQSWKSLLEHYWLTGFSLIALGLCLALPLGFYVLNKNSHALLKQWHAGATLTLFLQANTTRAQVEHLLQQASAHSFVKQVDYLSAQDALAEFQSFSDNQQITQLLPHNPLTEVITIHLLPNHVTQTQLTDFKAGLAKNSIVKSITFDMEWLEKMQTVFYVIEYLMLFLGLVISSGMIFMVANTIRLNLERHRDEIEVLHLIGATNRFIRRPFLYRGSLFGLGSGIIALFIMLISAICLHQPLHKLMVLYPGTFSLQNLSMTDIVSFLIISIGLGWFGAILAFAQQRYTLICDK